VVHSQRLLQDWLRVALHLNLCVSAGRAGRSIEREGGGGEEEREMMGYIGIYPNTYMFIVMYTSDLALSTEQSCRRRQIARSNPLSVYVEDHIFKDLIPKGTFEL